MPSVQEDSREQTLMEIDNTFGDEFFFKYFYRHLSLPFLKILIKTSISPTQVTCISIFLGFIAAGMFFLAEYKFLVAGVVFLNLALILDKVDGQIARLKNQTSAWGAWIDAVGDTLTISLYFLFLTLGVYFQSRNPGILIVGLFCQLHLLMAFYVLATKPQVSGPAPRKEVSWNNNYFGLFNSLHVFLSLGCLLNQVYWMLLIFSCVGVLAWLPVIIRLYLVQSKNS